MQSSKGPPEVKYQICKELELLNQRREIWRLKAYFISAIPYCHEALELALRTQSIGLLKVQIMIYLQIVSESTEIHFLAGFFEISKADITCKAYHINVYCEGKQSQNLNILF